MSNTYCVKTVAHLPDIEKIEACEILDSRGNPTVSCCLQLQGQPPVFAAVPSGASTGTHEAHEIRDQDKQRYRGLGVQSSVEIIQNQLAPLLIQSQPKGQEAFDATLCEHEGSPQKSRWGANTLLALSIAYARACAQAQAVTVATWLKPDQQPIELPIPFMNVINGGRHAHNALAIQEFMIVPYGFSCFREALRCGSEVMHRLGMLLRKRYTSIATGDEGGYAPEGLKTPEEAFESILEAIELAGYSQTEVALALDCAAGEYHKAAQYRAIKSGPSYDCESWIKQLESWVSDYPIVSIEDPLAEDDWLGWQQLTKQCGQRIQIVGDDLFVTQTDRLKQGVSLQAANAVLLKPNQVGTLSECIACDRYARDQGYRRMISHRSGETEDSIIADLALALGCGQIKTGPCRQSDRSSKYNRLLWLSQLLPEARLAQASWSRIQELTLS